MPCARRERLGYSLLQIATTNSPNADARHRYSGPGTPNSLESAPMDESDSDAEPSRNRAAAVDDDDDDKYPVEGMYVSQAEKAEIMAMREVEREQIIAERMMEIERQRQNRLLRQMISSVENEERTQGKKKRNADTAELEGGEGKASRQRTGDKGESQGESHRGSAMDSLRRARAEKARRREDHERRKDAYSPRDRDSDRQDSDDDFGHRRSPTPEADEPRDQPPAELRDYDRVRLGRNEFAQVCFTPGFEHAITGCYIRIALGPHPETGIEQYRMALIKGAYRRGYIRVSTDKTCRFHHQSAIRSQRTQWYVCDRSVRKGSPWKGDQRVPLHRCLERKVHRCTYNMPRFLDMVTDWMNDRPSSTDTRLPVTTRV